MQSAASAVEVERALAAGGLYPIEVVPAAEAPPRGLALRRRRADVVEAIRYLATLLEAGFPLDRALATVADVMARPDVAAAILTVQRRVREGGSLAQAFAEQPHVFPRLAVGLTQAGERGGQLAEALGRLAEHLEQEETLRSQFLSAMMYPLVVVAVGGVALLVLLTYVLPRFAALLADAGAALPRSTALLLAIGTLLGQGWPALLGLAVLAFGFGAYSRRVEPWRTQGDALLLRLPVVGPLRQRLAAARFGRTLSTLLGSGLPILPSLEVAAGAVADGAVAEEVRGAQEEVRAGAPLAPALGRGRAFPRVFVQMVALGEGGGRLPEMLERAAVWAEQELRRGLERLVRLVEPTMIVVFGAVVGFVALALLQAIYGIRLEPVR